MNKMRRSQSSGSQPLETLSNNLLPRLTKNCGRLCTPDRWDLFALSALEQRFRRASRIQTLFVD